MGKNKRKNKKKNNEKIEKIDKQRKIEINKKVEKYKKKYKVIDSFENIPINDCILLYLNSWGNEYLIKKYTKKGKSVYQHIRNNNFIKGSGIKEINQRIKKFNVFENKIKKLFLENIIFLVKEFDKKPNI